MNIILQIGEGNFLRAFAESYIQNASNTKVVICQPRNNTRVINALKAQNNEYDIIVRGRLNGNIVNERQHINCVEECIDTNFEYSKLKQRACSDDLKIVISNTTEAGICFDESDTLEAAPKVSFPAKLTALLYERFLGGKSPLVLLPCELIENNGDNLKACVLKYASLWNLPSKFIDYINSCSFCNTLVDRIVTGHIADDEDLCSVACEPYKSWVIQADDWAKSVIPFNGVTYVENINDYRICKVRILNGVHTMSVLAAYMAGFDIVRDMMNDKLFSSYISLGIDEIKSTINLPCDDFAASVVERFNNPFIDHKLLDISLNSVSKFKARCLDTIVDYYKLNGKLPKVLTFSLSALIAFYLKFGNREYEVKDSKAVIDFFSQSPSPSVGAVLKNYDFWGVDLTTIDGMLTAVEGGVNSIKTNGIIKAIKEVIYE